MAMSSMSARMNWRDRQPEERKQIIEALVRVKALTRLLGKLDIAANILVEEGLPNGHRVYGFDLKRSRIWATRYLARVSR
jgi:hypothetical protein